MIYYLLILFFKAADGSESEVGSAGPSKVAKPNTESEQMVDKKVIGKKGVNKKGVDVYNASNWNPYLSEDAKVLAKQALANAKKCTTEKDWLKLYEDTRILMRQRLHEDPPLSVKELRDMFEWLKKVRWPTKTF